MTIVPAQLIEKPEDTTAGRHAVTHVDALQCGALSNSNGKMIEFFLRLEVVLTVGPIIKIYIDVLDLWVVIGEGRKYIL